MKNFINKILKVRLSIYSLGLLVIAFALNAFRTELFGVVKGYAPHNLTFNLSALLQFC